MFKKTNRQFLQGDAFGFVNIKTFRDFKCDIIHVILIHTHLKNKRGYFQVKVYRVQILSQLSVVDAINEQAVARNVILGSSWS